MPLIADCRVVFGPVRRCRSGRSPEHGHQCGSTSTGLAVALTQRPAGYRTTVLGQAPVSYWLLDEPTGTILSNQVRESSVGILGDAVHLDQPGIGPDDGFRGFPNANRSVYLDGSPEKAAVVDIDGPHGVRRKEGAVSFWIRRSPDQDMRSESLWLAGFGSEASRVPFQAILHTRLSVSGRVVFEIENGDADVYLSSSRSIVDGRWHQVVASWGPSSVDLYVDGRHVGSDSESRTMEEANLSGRFVRFGKPSTQFGIAFTRVVETVLRAVEIVGIHPCAVVVARNLLSA